MIDNKVHGQKQSQAVFQFPCPSVTVVQSQFTSGYITCEPQAGQVGNLTFLESLDSVNMCLEFH